MKRFLIMAALFVGLSACEKDDDDNNDPPVSVPDSVFVLFIFPDNVESVHTTYWSALVHAEEMGIDIPSPQGFITRKKLVLDKR